MGIHAALCGRIATDLDVPKYRLEAERSHIVRQELIGVLMGRLAYGPTEN